MRRCAVAVLVWVLWIQSEADGRWTFLGRTPEEPGTRMAAGAYQSAAACQRGLEQYLATLRQATAGWGPPVRWVEPARAVWGSYERRWTLSCAER
jgi:hypothetical protein